jgi:hypothetical protein
VAGPVDPPVDDLRSLQLVWWAFVGAVTVLALAVPVLAAGTSSTVPASLPAALTLAVGAGALISVLAIDRGLTTRPPGDDRAAVTELRSRLVLQLAVAEAPALLGVALSFALGPPWIVAVAALPTLLALLRVRPSRRRIDRLDQAWRAAGGKASLRRALIDRPADPPTAPDHARGPS